MMMFQSFIFLKFLKCGNSVDNNPFNTPKNDLNHNNHSNDEHNSSQEKTNQSNQISEEFAQTSVPRIPSQSENLQIQKRAATLRDNNAEFKPRYDIFRYFNFPGSCSDQEPELQIVEPQETPEMSEQKIGNFPAVKNKQLNNFLDSDDEPKLQIVESTESEFEVEAEKIDSSAPKNENLMEKQNAFQQPCLTYTQSANNCSSSENLSKIANLKTQLK